MGRTVRPGRDDVVDAILAVVLGAVSVASVLTPDTGTAYQFRAPNAGVAVLALAAALPFAVRRRRPLTVGLAVSAVTVTMAALRWNTGIGPFLVLFALYTIGYGREMRAVLAGLALTCAGLGLLLVLRVPYFEDPADAVFFGFATLAWGFGRWTRGRRTERERAVARAVAGERARTIEAERAVLAERLHIARELHDVVSHTLTVIAVQAGTARLRLARGDEGSDGGSAVPALTAIETTAREALADLRRMLGPLRTTLADAVPEPGPLPDTPARGPVREGLVDAVLAAVLAALGIAWAFVRDPSLSYAYPRPDALP